jgi:hypothetical protein
VTGAWGGGVGQALKGVGCWTRSVPWVTEGSTGWEAGTPFVKAETLGTVSPIGREKQLLLSMGRADYVMITAVYLLQL